MTAPVGAPTTLYYLILSSAMGVRLGIVRDYISIELTRIVSAVGALVFTVPAHLYDREDFPIDGVVEAWRAPLNEPASLFLETIWFIRRRTKAISGGMSVWKITCYDALYILGDPSGNTGRVIAYNAGNAYSEKLDEADDMCKAIMRENVGSLATDVTRSLATYLSITADTSQAQIIRKEFSRRNVLATLQELAQASTLAGTYLAFDIICLTPPNETATPTFALEFRTYITQRGVDRRASSANPILIGPDFGNMDEIELDEDWTDEQNYIYMLGQGVANVISVVPAFDAVRIGQSPFNRREFVANSSSTGDAAALQDEADAALRAGRPKTKLSARLLNTRQIRFGVDWNWGDYLTAQVEGFAFDCRVEAISVRITQSDGEDINGQLQGENVV